MWPLSSRFTNEDGESVRNYIRIPKREIFKLVGNCVEAMVNYWYGVDDSGPKKMAQEFFEGISPVNIQGENLEERAESIVSSLNPALKGGLEQIFNRDTFRHIDIVPEYKKSDPAELQYRKTTPEVYKKLGRAIHVSPLRLQQLVSATTAGLLTQFEGFLKEPQGDRDWYINKPVIKRFVRSGIVSNEAETKKLKEAVQMQTNDTAIKKMLAEQVYETIKDKNDDEKLAAIKKVYDKDPLLGKQILQTVKDANKGLTYQDRLIGTLNINSGDRAAYIAGAMSRLPNDEARAAWKKDLINKGVITPKVNAQLEAGIIPKRRSLEEPPPE